MRARDAERTATLRLAISALNYRRIERNAPLSDAEQDDVIRKQMRQRDDAIEAYDKAARADLADKERRERTILQAYLPEELSGEVLRAAVREALAGLGPDATFGDAMKAAVGALKGRAGGAAIQAAVKDELAARSGT